MYILYTHSQTKGCIRLFKYFVVASLCFIAPLFPSFAQASCGHPFDVEGIITVENCDPDKDECIDGIRAIYEYGDALDSLDDGGDDVLTISIMSSPWRLYGQKMRIMRAKELATLVKSDLNDKVKSVKLYSSWSEHAHVGRSKSLSQELSEALDGLPVEGIDGFLWQNENGEYYATKQAFTVTLGRQFPYRHRVGEDLMMVLPYGAFIHAQDYFVRTKDLRGLRYAAVGWDVFILCPEKALATFELAASMSDAISAYNAAIMRLERRQDGDYEAALKLLKQAVELGDSPAEALLHEITSKEE